MKTTTIVKHVAVIVGLFILVWILFIGGDNWLQQLQHGAMWRDRLLGMSVGMVSLVIAYELFAKRESDQM